MNAVGLVFSNLNVNSLLGKQYNKKENFYQFDGEWLQLKEKRYWSWLKLLGPLKIPIRRTIFESNYGPTFKTDDGFYSWRFVVAQNKSHKYQLLFILIAFHFQTL